ncbi:hypothetical protein, partial [Zoogloea sp.]|uniref:hypothetical protein n=1 Tax=Zoogloea sp. TaxID=49181 RepID=UPI002633EF8E
LRPSGYEPDELPDCSTPRLEKPDIRQPKEGRQGLFAAHHKKAASQPATEAAERYFPTSLDTRRRRFSAARPLLRTSRTNRAAATTATQTQTPMMM